MIGVQGIGVSGEAKLGAERGSLAGRGRFDHHENRVKLAFRISCVGVSTQKTTGYTFKPDFFEPETSNFSV